jgi:hypothetical protein
VAGSGDDMARTSLLLSVESPATVSTELSSWVFVERIAVTHPSRAGSLAREEGGWYGKW